MLVYNYYNLNIIFRNYKIKDMTLNNNFKIEKYSNIYKT